jgi:hypothetical protein
MMSWWNEIFPKRPDVKPTSHVVLARAPSRSLLQASAIPGFRLMELRRDGEYDAVCVEIDVERPQDLVDQI